MSFKFCCLQATPSLRPSLYKTLELISLPLSFLPDELPPSDAMFANFLSHTRWSGASFLQILSPREAITLRDVFVMRKSNIHSSGKAENEDKVIPPEVAVRKTMEW